MILHLKIESKEMCDRFERWIIRESNFTFLPTDTANTFQLIEVPEHLKMDQSK
jgi:hypothetical protein